MASKSVITDLFPGVEERRKKAKTRQSAQTSMRDTMKDMFGGLEDTLDSLQKPSDNPVHNKEITRSEKVSPRDTVSGPETVSRGDRILLTRPETVLGPETVPGEKILIHPETVSGFGKKLLYDALRKTQHNKLRFLGFVLGQKQEGKPWRFNVKAACSALNILYLTARDYAPYFRKKGWLDYRIIKGAGWQGLEVLWMIKEVEEYLIENGLVCGSISVSKMTISPDTVSGKKVLTRPDTVTRPDSLLDRKINSNLSIKVLTLSDEDISFQWPHLFSLGFGTQQIQGICDNLTKYDKSTDHLITSFDYIEHELASGTFKAAGGAEIKKPLGYIFNALAKNGVWRRPADYVSPEELAIRNQTEEIKAQERAKEEQEQTAFKIWDSNLDVKEREKILKGKKGPAEVWLKKFWKENIKEFPS